MRLSPTLTRYIGRQFVVQFLTMLAILLVLIYVADALELLRRAAKREDVTFWSVFHMSMLKLPQLGQEIFPFAILFGGIFAYWRLTRNQELVVVRAAGISAWEFLWPAVAAAVMIGVLKVTIINPAGSLMVAEYERLDNQELRGRSNAVDISATGLWLRQIRDDGYTIVHARKVDSTNWSLTDVSVLFFDSKDELIERADAAEGRLGEGEWELDDAWINKGGPHSEKVPLYRVTTDLDRGEIEDSFASPDSMSFWSMPRFIQTMEATGFPATRLRIYYQNLLAQPFLFAGLVLMAAAVALRMSRRGGNAVIAAIGLGLAFGLFFLNDVVRALGLHEAIPVLLAAWTPAVLAMLAGAGALLYLEDG